MRKNPFPTTLYIGPEYFCDREQETKTLLSNIAGGLSTTVTAIRRMGKTGLIHHVFTRLPKSYLPVYVDILATTDKKDFLNALTSAVVNAIPEETTMGKQIFRFIRSLRPVITYDPLSGMPQVTLEGSKPEIDRNIQTVLTFLENLNKKVVIAIDEFQQILEYPEKNTDAWLRSIIQNLSNVIFLFSGSQNHLMTGLFTNPQKPFFRSTQILHFDAIPLEVYAEFILQQFTSCNKQVDKELVTKILDWTQVHTYYVQVVCNRIFANSGKKVTEHDFRQETQKLLSEQEIVFFQYRDLLTTPQWNLLKAIGMEPDVFAPTSMDFIKKHNLGNPATVLRSLKALETKEMIYHHLTPNGKKSFHIYDLLLKRWIETKYSIL